MERRSRGTRPLDVPSIIVVLVVVMAVGMVRALLPGGPVDGLLRFVAWAGSVAVAAWIAQRRPVLSPTLGAFLGVFLLFLLFGSLWTMVTGADTDVARRFVEVAETGPPWGALVLLGLLAASVNAALTALLAWLVLWLRRFAHGEQRPAGAGHDDEDAR